jgi:DNA-binding NarL/FixJ family response regulator
VSSLEQFLATGPSRLPSPGKRLTPREVSVLRQVAKGLTNDAVSRRLGYAPGTVSTMVMRIYRKLEVTNRAAAVDQGWRRGYLRKDDS